MATFAPFGFCLGFSPTLGDDEESLVSTSDTLGTTPTADWESLRRSGYTTVRARVFEGIPYIFGPRRLYTTAGVEAAMPSPDYTFSAALMTLPGDASGVDMNREKGIADGRTLDTILRRETLQDEGLLPILFKTPALRARLTNAITDPTATNFDVTLASGTLAGAGWPSSGFGYVGRELIRFGSLGSATFGGITRGVCGLPYYHRSSAASGYSEVTDVPIVWVGRFVIDYEHLCGPDGRYLGDTWCRVGTYCRERWKGYVDDIVQEHVAGKHIRAVPLVRLPGQKTGAKITGRPLLNADRSPKLYWTSADTITAGGNTATVSGPVTFNDTIASLRVWAIAAQAGLGSDWTTWVDDRATYVSFAYQGGAAQRVTLVPRAWFLQDGQVTGNAVQRVLMADFTSIQSGWLVLKIDASEDATADDVPERGFLQVEIGGAKELMAYDGLHRDAAVSGAALGSPPDVVALRIVGRGIGNTTKLDPWTRADEATVAIVSGYQGSWSDAFRTMATSSGTGARGPRDTLGFGFGLGIPEDWLDLDSLTAGQLANTYVDALSAASTSIADVLCGWLALWQKCLIQRRNDAGKVVLAVADTAPSSDPTLLTLGVDDVLLGGHGAPKVMPPPNIIEIDAGDGNPKAIPRDRTRMANEGDRRWTIKAAGVKPDDAANWAVALLTNSDGQAAVAIECPGWKELQAGDQRVITTGHPLVYDVAVGAYAPGEIPAVCMSVEPDEFDDILRTQWLIAGQAPAATLLCPSARVRRAISSDTLEVEDGHQARFAAGYKVYVYEPGSEGTRKTAMTVWSVSTSPSRIQMTGTLPSWCNADTVVTYDDIATSIGDQDDYMYVRASKFWR